MLTSTMWHPFHLMGDALAIPPELRDAPLRTPCRLTFRECVIRWFKHQATLTQWAPDVDTQPGLVLTRRIHPSGELEIGFSHAWRTGTLRSLTGTLACSPTAPYAPLRYRLRQSLDAARGTPAWPAREETGQIAATGALAVHSSLAGHRQHAETQAPAWVAQAALMAGLPADLATFRLPPDTCLLGEGMEILGPCTLRPCEPNHHPLAEGLRGISLVPATGMPIELWSNRHGTVIYACEGPNRAWALSTLEDLS